MATEQHFLIKIYGYFKHFITRREMIALLIKKAKLKPCQEIGIGPNAKAPCLIQIFYDDFKGLIKSAATSIHRIFFRAWILF